MAPPVHTQRFLLASGPTGWTTYMVPAGYRAVVTCLTCAWGAAGSSLALWIGSVSVYNFRSQVNNNSEAVTMRVAAYAGEAIQVERAGEMYTVSVTGYIFRDTEGPVGLAFDSLEAPPLVSTQPAAAA